MPTHSTPAPGGAMPAACTHTNAVALVDKLTRVQLLITAIDMAASDLDRKQAEAIKAIAELAEDGIRDVLESLAHD